MSCRHFAYTPWGLGRHAPPASHAGVTSAYPAVTPFPHKMLSFPSRRYFVFDHVIAETSLHSRFSNIIALQNGISNLLAEQVSRLLSERPDGSPSTPEFIASAAAIRADRGADGGRDRTAGDRVRPDPAGLAADAPDPVGGPLVGDRQPGPPKIPACFLAALIADAHAARRRARFGATHPRRALREAAMAEALTAELCASPQDYTPHPQDYAWSVRP